MTVSEEQVSLLNVSPVCCLRRITSLATDSQPVTKKLLGPIYLQNYVISYYPERSFKKQIVYD